MVSGFGYEIPPQISRQPRHPDTAQLVADYFGSLPRTPKRLGKNPGR